VSSTFALIAQVEHYPYDANFMLFMDYRDYRGQDVERDAAPEIPTFLYAMPVTSTRIFFEVLSCFLFGVLDRLHVLHKFQVVGCGPSGLLCIDNLLIDGCHCCRKLV
jgi:hypothetical protein